MNFRKALIAAAFVTVAPWAKALANSESCILPESSEVLECLNSQVLPDIATSADKTYRDYYRRLSQAYALEIQDEDLSLFKRKYFPEGEYAAIEIVGERLDGSGKEFSIRKDSYFLSGKKKKEQTIKSNLNEAVQFVAYFHARNFGKKNGFLFNFNRVEISAFNPKSNEGYLALDGQTLRINLPEDRQIKAKDLLEMWNSGDVLLTVSQAKTPRPIMKIVAHFGSMQDKAGMAVLENWKLFNPISDFRVQLAAIYLKHAQGLVAKVRSLTEDQVRSWLDGMALPPATAAGSDVKGFLLASMVSGETYAGALDSLFSEKQSSDSGDINVINRTAGLCLVKVSNSHVIKVDWDESEFAEEAKTVVESKIVVKGSEVTVTAASHQDVHIVNDKTWVGGVCVDTNDNVQVNLDSILRLIKKKMTDRSVIKTALQQI